MFFGCAFKLLVLTVSQSSANWEMSPQDLLEILNSLLYLVKLVDVTTGERLGVILLNGRQCDTLLIACWL